GRKIDSTLKFARPFAHNTMEAKYLETQSHTRPAGSREALLREAAGRAKVVIIHRALFVCGSDLVTIITLYIHNTIVNSWLRIVRVATPCAPLPTTRDGRVRLALPSAARPSCRKR